MKSAKIHSLQIKFITLITILLATAVAAQAQATSGDWLSYTSSGYDSGSGTKDDPYIIKTPAQLAYFAKDVRAKNNNNSGTDMTAYVELGADIDLSAHNWQPIGYSYSNARPKGFSGHFDGKGHVISNMYINWGGDENSGFFAFINGGSVKNLILDNAQLINTSGNIGNNNNARRVGVLAAGTNNNPTIENIIVKKSKIAITKECQQKGTWFLVGGLVGGSYLKPTYANCYVDVDIDLTKVTSYDSNSLDRSWFGGLLGASDGSNTAIAQPTIENVYVAGSVAVNRELSTLGTVVGRYNNTNSLIALKGKNYYENVPTVNGTATTTGNIDGTKSSNFGETDFFDAANEYADGSTNDLFNWKNTDGNLSLINTGLSVKEKYATGTTKTSYVLSGADNTTATIKWMYNGEEITPDEGTNGTQITIPLYNHTRKGYVTITMDGQTYKKSFAPPIRTYAVDGLYAASYAGGRGTKADPYIIENDLQLARLAYDVNRITVTANNKRVFNGLYFKITKDIDLSAALWTPIGGTAYVDNQPVFAGRLTGGGHSIKNMRIIWTDRSGVWSTWGFFAQLWGQSANEASFCSVTDIIFDNASLEKQENYAPIGNGMNLGILVGEVNPFTEVGNIIVKHSTITDFEETYTWSKEWQIGGMIANIINKGNSDIYRIYNLSCDTKIDMLKNATNSLKKAWIGGVFGGLAVQQSSNSYQIYPTNIYAHGAAIDLADATNLKKGAITANGAISNTSTWFYANDVAGTAATSYGTKRAEADFAPSFVRQNNTYLQDNIPSDSCIWVYSSDKGFAFGNTVLKLDRTDGDVITATTPDKDGKELYYWYVSQDRKSWTQVKNGDDTALLSHTLTLPYQTYDLYVYATLQDLSSSSQIIKVEKLTVDATLNVADDGTYSVNVTNNLWKNNDKFTISYEWTANGSVVGNGSTYKPSEGKDKISCHVIVKDKTGKELLNQTVYKQTVVYLCPKNFTASDGTTYTAGVDDFDNEDKARGYSPTMPVRSWKGAYSKLEKGASWTENVIVLMGTSDRNVTNGTPYINANSNEGNNPWHNLGFNTVARIQGGNNVFTSNDWDEAKKSPLYQCNTTITGSYNGVNYDGKIEMGGDSYGLHIWGDTRFENITFNHVKEAYDIIYCQYNNLEMGKGVQMTNYPASSQGYEKIEGSTVTSVQIFGGFANDGRFAPLTTPGNLKKMEESMPHKEKGFSITLKSGHYSCVCVGGRQSCDGAQNGVMGSPYLPIKCTIDVDIDQTYNDDNSHNANKADYDVGVILAGNHEGAMIADVDIIVRSGKVARVVSGTLGDDRKFGDGDGLAPYNTYMGRANILVDPVSSEYAQEGEPTETTNNRVVITELYGGSMGRGFKGSLTVDNPFYGYSTVTINGGTFKILPEGNTYYSQIFSGIYGAGAGGTTGIGTDSVHTNDQRIAYWKDAKKNVMYYGPYDRAKDNLVTFHCYNSDTQSYTEVDPTETNTKITINGGVFGTLSQPIDGVYAGGSGYMSQSLWTAGGATPSPYGGNIYGKPGETVASLTIKGGEFYCTNGIFAGGRGTDKYFSSNRVGDITIGGNRADYKELGKTYGDVELTINEGIFHCPVYGGGYGVADGHEFGRSDNSVETLTNMARIFGKSTVNINGGTFYKNIYGGGDMALVDNSGGDGVATNVNVNNSADIRGSVFGGGNGRPYLKQAATGTGVTISDKGTEHPELVGKVIGGTSLTFIGSSQMAPYIYGDIYGGGNLAQVEGNTYINLYAANFAGQIFGGGKGDTTTVKITSADITGDTYVTLAQDQGGQEVGDDGQREDMFSINVIWNKLWDDKTESFYVWSADVERSITVDESRFYKDSVFVNPHNIYGGGNLACNVAGTANVTVLKGMTPYSLLTTQAWKSSYEDNEHPHFYVFGGGFGKNTTVGNTEVNVDVEGDYGIYDAETDNSDEQLSNKWNFDTMRANRFGSDNGTNARESGNMNVFDNSKGIPNFTVLGVMGGGYAGLVTGNSKVTVDGQTFLHRIYGGGFGDPESTKDNTTGQIGGNTEVYVKGAHTYGDVFGGGAGVAPDNATDAPYKQVAQVMGTTMVEISDDAKVYGKVYGGGDIANVGEYQETKPADYYDTSKLSSVSTLDQTVATDDEVDTKACTLIDYEAKGYRSFVNIVGGDIFGNVFGGGKGLTREKMAQYDQVGRINGNTLVHIANTPAENKIQTLARKSDIDDFSQDADGNDIPYVWNRVYGGCAYGTVDGNTLVHIEGGMLGLNVFGGGYGNVDIENDMTDDGSGTSTDSSTLEQVLGKKDTNHTGTYANILGNTKVLVDGGSWIWNRLADVNGNIKTWVGAEAENNKICNNLDEFKEIVHAINSAKTLDDITNAKAKAAITTIKNNEDTREFYNIETGLFRKNHNIFGGGNRACYVGTYLTDNTVKEGTGDAVVEINHSPLTDITDAKGNSVSLLDCTTLQGLCWYLCSKVTSHPQFSVFGAGYGANTKVGKTYVYARPGARVSSNNGQSIVIDGKRYRYLNHRKDMQSYYAAENAYWDDFLKVSREDKKRYYGSADGGNADGTDNDTKTYARYRASRCAWSLGAPNFTFMEVHGGGFSGYVAGDTYVETDCQLCCRNLFGAGLGAEPYGTFTNGNDYDFGSVGGNSRVFIKAGNVSQNVYGGGAGVESVRVDGNEIIDFKAKTGKIVDFPNMARVNGKTEVSVYGETINYGLERMERTLIFGSVYGGGDVANVGKETAKTDGKQFTHEVYSGTEPRTTMVNIRGGQLFSQVFAGGRGRTKDVCADYTKLGGVYGNAFIIVDRPMIRYPYLDTDTWKTLNPTGDGNMAHPADGVNEDLKPYLWNRIYGGCESGTVYGNTLVAINDGHLCHNIFGGGWGSCDTTYVDNVMVETKTSANVTGNTNMIITGGNMTLTSYWLDDQRSWEPAEIIGDKTYSPQYDHQTLKFKINHNIYAGGNTACVVGEKDADGNLVVGSGNTYLTMTKGLLNDDTQVVTGQNDGVRFFERDEWKEVYNKVGSPHFGVFGGGFGENTNILGDTHLNVQMQGRGSINDFDINDDEAYKHFIGGYSVMDIIGGGYSGKVEGETHIVGDGGVFCRRVFGGGFYNSVKATHVDIKAIDTHDIFGGGLMGDVLKSTTINIGTKTNTSESSSATTFTNDDIYIHGSIYGGNDVSGYVNVVLDHNGYFADNGGNGTNINIYGGHIFGNVYGAGNGDYLYALDKKGNTKVTVNEYYPLNPNDPDSEKEPLVYTVPMRETMPSYKAASDAAKIVNINSWRPLTNKVSINIEGNSASDTVSIKGDVYGGGNSATVQKVQKQNVRATETVGDVKMNIGNHVSIGRVFMGCNGDALFATSEDNDFMNKFQKLNGDVEDYSKELNLADTIDWMNDPSNKGISTLYLPTKNEERPLVYPHLLDLYFQPVETDIQGTLTWNGTTDGKGLTNCTIGTFCCGGNRGNMNVYPLTAEDYPAGTPTESMKVGNILEYTFPAGLTITDKIVGGCNNANYDYKGMVEHEGGYLLGEIHSTYPFIKLNIQNKFAPKEREGAYVGGNVYGGCFRTGTIRGDVSIVLESDMLEGKSKEKLEKSNDLLSTNAEYSALNVYGAGYGLESYVYGNCYVKMGRGIACTTPSYSEENIFNPSGSSANFIYGGGQQGNVIGKTDVKVLNGHVFKSVTGGSYSGFVWGSTQIRIGFPKYYVVNPGYGGLFTLNRTDQNNKDIDKDKQVASETIKQSMRLINDDIITQGVYDAISARHNFETNSDDAITDEQKKSFFKEVTEATPSVGWDNVNIVIGEAVYGGGYSLAHGSSATGDNTTVLKYDADHNLDNGFDSSTEKSLLAKLGGTTAGFGGNTTIVIGDRTTAEASSTASDGDTSTSSTSVDRDHITISRQDMKKANVADGQDLLGYYWKDADNKYHYIYQAGVYYKKGNKPDKMEGDDVYEYDNEGGIFGDGHLSYAQGFRSADLTGYGFASSTISSPKIINTFQRMDIVRLTDNCFSLLGARDYATNATDKTPYSISRVGEIQMIANNVVGDGGGLVNTTESTPARARNYMGFANNIHYVGALYSNVKFTDEWHDGKGKVGSSSYMSVKQQYIDDYNKASDDEKDNGAAIIFEKRNNGTAKNMIGIASGYALKVQNAQEVKTDGGAIEEKLYYGPIYGVIEMNLIDVREDEGGGYVYADNVHKRTAQEGDAAHEDDFLQATGNFVFPYTPLQGRYIVDDCFPVGYESISDKSTVDDVVPAHYWYVTGFNYHYTAHITGYTFNSSDADPRTFNSSNLDGIVALSGLKPSQNVNIESWKMYSAHDAAYECDLEKRNYTEGNEAFGKYSLRVGAANSLTYDGTGFAAELNMKENASSADCNIISQKLPSSLPDGAAKIVFQLEDRVNNTTSDYYDSHLSQPCKGTLVLSAPALDTEGNEVQGNVALTKLYTRNDDGTYTIVTEGHLDTNTTYYYKNGETNIYQEVKQSNEFYTRNDDTGEYVSVNMGDVSLGKDVIYYCRLKRFYTYAIDLTVDYVQGPDIEGGITIVNCALPGEMIRLKKDKVTIKADQAFSVNGYYWRIGKRKNVNGEWVFDSETPWSKNTTSKDYDTFNQSDKEGKGLFAGCYYNKTEDYLDVPAYYFMDGYGVQLGVTMNMPGLDDILPVKMIEADKLTVHNYHRMDPHKTNFNLHLAEAIKRAKEEAEAAAASTNGSTIEVFAQPRIYLSDQSDLTAFTNFVDTIGTNSDAPRYGAYAQFILQNDLTVADKDYDGSTIADFAGTLHGNGHLINGIAAGHCLFNSISGNVYNLGLPSGKISNMQPTDGKIAGYHCSFEYLPDAKAKSVVYRMNGTACTDYTAEDFRYGKVAYDLNEYYLRGRYSNATDEDKQALKYVYDYYANGDYQYAQRTDAITGKTTGITYLRTGRDSDLPNYEQAETRHDKTHIIDKARAQNYVAANADTPESRSGDYLPLFNARGFDTDDINDFIFWGQLLQSTPADYPTTIASHKIGYMSNGVWRTAAYYGDTKLSTFHYNALESRNSALGTYVHIPSTTAIDFTCMNDLPKAIDTTNSGIFYPPVGDNASSFHNFTVKNGITQNLLVYTDADNADNTDEAYDVVDKALSYTESTKETLISGHHITKTNNGYTAPLFHLVERTPAGLNSEGDVCDNNDLCVPIQFTVTDHAWYVRRPMNYADDVTGAWEGICLPFTVHKASASLNGELTHFYGTPTEAQKADPSTNTNTLHHEYWLRGIMKVDDGESATTATFQRPGAVGSGLFAPIATDGTALSASVSYTFNNPFFIDTYESRLYDKDANSYYAQAQTFQGYQLLTSGVPYIVRFPGNRYYEFDLTSAFYNSLLNRNEAAQTVTFNAYGPDNATEQKFGAVTIPVTGQMTTTVEGYAHQGTFAATKVAEFSVYGMNAGGTAFDDASTLATVMPFRTYMKPVALNAKSRSAIFIAEQKGDGEIVPELNKDESVSLGDYLIIRPIGGSKVRVECTRATTLNVVTTTGQLYRILDIQPGTSTYSGFQPGIYLFGGKKILIK